MQCRQVSLLYFLHLELHLCRGVGQLAFLVFDVDLAVRTSDPVPVRVDPFQNSGMTLLEIFKAAMVDNCRHLRGGQLIDLHILSSLQRTVNGDNGFDILILVDV